MIACDQYTSSPEYWDNERVRIGGAPSTLGLICPEAFLSDSAKITENIARKSREYLGGLLREYDGAVLVKRTVADSVRYGLVCLADLEYYDYMSSGSAREKYSPPAGDEKKRPILPFPPLCVLATTTNGGFTPSSTSFFATVLLDPDSSL